MLCAYELDSTFEELNFTPHHVLVKPLRIGTGR